VKKQNIFKKISLIVLSSLVMVSTAGAVLDEKLFDSDSMILSENDFDFALSEELTANTTSNEKINRKSGKNHSSSLFTKLLAIVGGFYGLNKGHDGLRTIFGDALFTLGVQYGMAFERVEGECGEHSKQTEKWNAKSYKKMIVDAIPVWAPKEKCNFKNHPGILATLDLQLQTMTGWTTGCLFYESAMNHRYYTKPNLIADPNSRVNSTSGFANPVYSFQYLQAVPYYLQYAYNVNYKDFGRFNVWDKQEKTVARNLLNTYKTYDEAINAFYKGFQLSFFNKSLGALYLKEMIKFAKYLPSDITKCFTSSHSDTNQEHETLWYESSESSEE